jgi:hypothetical protein
VLKSQKIDPMAGIPFLRTTGPKSEGHNVFWSIKTCASQGNYCGGRFKMMTGIADAECPPNRTTALTDQACRLGKRKNLQL